MASNLKISIDVLLNGAKEIDKLAGALDRLKKAGSGTSTPARSFRDTEAAMLRQAQAAARLQKAQGDLTGAIATLKNALSGVNQTSSAAVAAFTQLSTAQARLAAQTRAGFGRIAGTVREAGESIQQAGFAAMALTAGIVELGRRAVSSAVGIDRQVNVLRAFTGSAANAEKRLAELIKTAQQSPGLTTSLALTLDSQLRVAGATEKAINKVLPAIGKLNAVSSLQDPQRFVQNLVQLITQNFERIDLKELVGQSPLGGELIKEVFGVDSPINAAAIRESAKKLGITTIDALADALGTAAANNPKLAKITESIGTQLEKLADRVAIALRPLGQAIVNALIPLVQAAAPIIEEMGRAFASLSPQIQQFVIAMGAIAVAVGPALIGIGAVLQSVGAIGGLIAAFRGVGGTAAVAGGGLTIFTASLRGAAVASAAFLATPLGLAIAGIAVAVGIAALAWAQYKTVTEKALAVAKQQAETQAELNALNASITALKAKQVSTEDLTRAVGLLNPAEQAYIQTLQGQSAVIARATAELEKRRVVVEQIAAVERGNLVAGLVETFDAFQKQTAQVQKLSGQYASAVKDVEQFGNSQKIVQSAAEEFDTEGNVLRDTLVKIGDAFRKTKTDADTLEGTGKELAKSFIASAGGADKARAVIDSLANSKQITAQAATAARSAINAFSAQVVAGGDNAQRAANQVFNLAAAIKEAGLAGARSDINKKIEAAVIAAQNAQGGLVNSALKSLNEQGIEQGVKGLKKLEGAVETIQNKFGLSAKRPRSAGAGVSRTAETSQTVRETEQLERAEFGVVQEFAKRAIAFAQQSEEEETEALEAALEKRTISTAEFYGRKAALAKETAGLIAEAIQSEIEFEQKQFAAIAGNKAKRLAVAKTASDKEQIKIDAEEKRAQLTQKLIGLQTQLDLTQRKANIEQEKSLRKQAQLVEDIANAVTGLQEALLRGAGQGVSEAIKAVQEATLRRLDEQRSILDAGLATSIQAIQNQVNAGLLGEIGAREKILALEAQKRVELERNLDLQLKVLQAQRGAVGATAGDKSRIDVDIAQIQLSLERLKTLGVDPLFQRIRDGLEQDLSGAFFDFIFEAEFGLNSLRKLALGIVDGFKRAIAKVLTQKIEEKLIKPITDFFLDKVLGIKTIDPAQIANTVATNANTAALTALTFQLQTQGVFGQGGAFDGLSGAAEGASAADAVTGPQGPLAAFFAKIKGAFEKFVGGLKGVGTGLAGGLRSIASAVVGFLGSIIGLFGGGSGGASGSFPSITFDDFAEGGYTGEGAKYQPAGIVHAGEYVMPMDRVRQWGSGFFEAIRAGSITPASVASYLGSLSNFRPALPRSGSFASGGLVADPGGNAAAARGTRIINVIDPSLVQEFIDSSQGEQVILNRITRSPAKFRAALGVA